MQVTMLPTLIVAVRVVATAANETVPSASAAAATNTTATVPNLRSRHRFAPVRRYAPHQQRDLLLGGHKTGDGGGSASAHWGCLGYSDSELSESWKFSSEAPSCSWVHAAGGSSDSSGSSGGGNSGSGSSGGGSSSGSGNSGSGNSGSGSSGGGSSSGGGGGSSSGSGGSSAADSGSGGSGSGSGSSGGSGSNGGSGGNGYDSNNDDNDQSYGSDSGGNQGDSDDGNADGNDDYNGNMYDSGDENGGDGNGEDDSEYDASNDDQVVVSNEDVYGGDADYDPLDDFNIEACDTYENLWIWDLALTCNNSTINGDGGFWWGGGSGCNCSFAEELFGNGLLACEDVSLCPADCGICSTCLELLGCGDGKPPRVIERLSRPLVLYILAAALSLLLFAAVAHYSRKRWKPQGGQLNENLLVNPAAKASLEIAPTSAQKKKRMKRQPPSFKLLVRGSDLSWRPLPSDEDYAASQQLRPTGTMSTTSTGRQMLAPPSDCSGSSSSDAAMNRIETGDSPTGSASLLHGERVFALDALFNNTQTETPIDGTFVPPVVGTFLQMNDSGGVTSFSVSPVPTQEDDFSDEETTHRVVPPRTMSTENGDDEATEKL